MLFNRAIFKFKAKVLDDAIGVVGFFNINGQGVVIVNRVDKFKEMKHVDTDDDFVHFALVEFKVVGFKREMDKDGVRFVHVDDFDAIFGKDDVGFQKDIF